MTSLKHIISSSQFDKQKILYLITVANEMEAIIQKGGSDMARHHILATLFYEPSTRTRLSFETAMLRLGGSIISETDINFSSAIKGEILQDTIRVVASYSDVIAIRSKHKGDAKLASEFSSVPIINGGDGIGEHPTQSLLDLFTIYKKYSHRIDKEKIKIAFIGDLKYGRTVHSLCQLLRLFENIEITFVAPDILQIPAEYATNPSDKFETILTNDIVQNSDILYMTRIQKERFQSLSEYEKVEDIFHINVEKVNLMKKDAILMHPFPRVKEIDFNVDKLPQAFYFEQIKNGLPIRMALIAYVLDLL